MVGICLSFPQLVNCARWLRSRFLAGHVAFFGFISEMKVPTDYPKALFLLQGTDTCLYLIAAVVIYRYGGKDVASPALGSTGKLMSKIAYGIAIPTVSSRSHEVRKPESDKARRLLSPVSSTATLPASTSMFACSAGRTVCTSAVFFQRAPGLVLR